MNLFIKFNSFLIVLMVAIFLNCRNGELKVIETYSPLQNPTYALIYYFLPSNLAGAGSTSIPRGFKSSGGSLFAVGISSSLYESTDGSTFTKKSFTLPNCSPTTGNATNYTSCNIVSVAKFGTTIYAIGLKQSGVNNSSNNSLNTVTEHKFYFASGSTLNDLNFTEITDSNLTSTYYLAGSILPSAASNTGFVFGFGSSSSAHKYCGTSTGSTWVCQAGTVSGNSPGFVALLNGTLTADIYFRWNGSGFTTAITGNSGNKVSVIFSGSRTIFNSGSTISYTSTDPGSWAGASLSTTNSIQSNGATGSYTLLGDFSGSLKAIGSSSSSNPTTYTVHSSSDNGTNWSNQGTISLPSGLSPSNSLASFNNTMFVYAQSSSGSFTQKYFKTTDFTNWTEFSP